MNLKPLFDRVVLKPIEMKEQTSSGIFIPERAVEKPQIAIVVAIGEGGLVDGKECEIKVKVGDKVLYSKFAGIPHKLNDEELIIIRQGDILAKIEGEN